MRVKCKKCKFVSYALSVFEPHVSSLDISEEMLRTLSVEQIKTISGSSVIVKLQCPKCTEKYILSDYSDSVMTLSKGEK